jgi:hypothetical protein
MSKKIKQGRFGPEMQEAMQDQNDFIQGILSHSCPAAADVLCGASRIGIVANEFAHNVGAGDQLRQESNDVSDALAELFGEQLQGKSPLAVANALFWAAARVAAIAADDCPECEIEESAKNTTTYTVN